MELRQLNYFAELCKVRSFTKASQNLNVAQPSVTKAIQQLESELGVRLVERSQKPLGLTPAGEQFYARVEVILKELNEAVEGVSRHPGQRRQPINVGLSPFTGIILDRILSSSDLSKEGIFFNLIRRSSVEILNRLINDELDLGWLIQNRVTPELEFIPLERQEAVLILPPDHPLQYKDEITFADLKNESLSTMVSNQNSVLAQIVLERCRQAGFEPVQGFTGRDQYHPDIQMAIQWVRNGLGPSFIPEHAAEEVTEDMPVLSVTPPIYMEVGLAYRKGRRLPPGTKKLIEYIREEYPKHIRRN